MKTKLTLNGLTGNFDLVTNELNANEVVNVPSGNLAATNAQAALNELQSDIDTRELAANKGIANGYASLDSGGKVPAAQLPNTVMEFKGQWNASTNSPTLANGTGNPGDTYIVSVAGTQNLGSGSVSYEVRDYVMYDGSIWQKSDASDAITSVFGRQGVVVATAGDYTASQVTNVPSGNVTSITVQAAIDELQFDIDTRASQTALTAHTGASTGVHGVSGSVVGTTGSQTLSGKSIDADANIITNIDNNDIKANAAIDATKISNGIVDNTEFDYLNGVTSAIQTQLNTHLPFIQVTGGLSDGSQLSPSATRYRQVHVITGSSNAVNTLSTTPFGGTPPPDGTMISVLCRSTTSLVVFPYSDATNGCLSVGDAVLAYGDSITFVWSTTMDRYVEISRTIGG